MAPDESSPPDMDSSRPDIESSNNWFTSGVRALASARQAVIASLGVATGTAYLRYGPAEASPWFGATLAGWAAWVVENRADLALASLFLSIVADAWTWLHHRRHRAKGPRPSRAFALARLEIIAGWMTAGIAAVVATQIGPDRWNRAVVAALGWAVCRATYHFVARAAGSKRIPGTSLRVSPHRWLWSGPIYLFLEALRLPQAKRWIGPNAELHRPANVWYLSGLGASLLLGLLPMSIVDHLREAELTFRIEQANASSPRPAKLAEMPKDGWGDCDFQAGTVFTFEYWNDETPQRRQQIAADVNGLYRDPGRGNVPCPLPSDPPPDGTIRIRLGPNDHGDSGLIVGPRARDWSPGSLTIVMPDQYATIEAAESLGRIVDLTLVRGHRDISSLAVLVDTGHGEECVFGLGSDEHPLVGDQCLAILASAIDHDAMIVGYNSTKNDVRFLSVGGREFVGRLGSRSSLTGQEAVTGYRRVAGRFATRDAWFP